MGILYFLGNALLSFFLSYAATKLDRYVQRRKKEKSPSQSSRGS
jgi:hypothetical protein